MNSLDGKVVVITGAGRGLGRFLAQHLQDQGAQIVIIGRGQEALDGTVALCEGRAVAYQADVGDAAQLSAAFSAIGEKFGKIDILINNAAIYDFFRLDEADADRIRRTVDANLLGPMLTARFGVEWLRKADGADIINISSESVRNPYAFLAAYASTKAGLENLSRGLRYELKPFGIRVTTLQVGIMADPDRQMTMDMETLPRFMEQNQAALAASGGEMAFSTVAHAILSLITLPRDASFEMVELRP